MEIKLNYKNKQQIIYLKDLNISSLYNEVSRAIHIDNKQFTLYIFDINQSKICIENFYHFEILMQLYNIRKEMTVYVEDKDINHSLIQNILLKKINFENSLDKERIIRQKKSSENDKAIKDNIEQKISSCKNEIANTLIEQLNKRCSSCMCSLIKEDFFSCIYCNDMILCKTCEDNLGFSHGHPFLLNKYQIA